MGICIGMPPKVPVSKEDEAQSKTIDRKLLNQRKILDEEIKLLLLGAGESGKSTIARQLKIIYMSGFTDEEKLRYRDIIHTNVQTSMKCFMLYLNSINVLETLSPSLQNKASIFLPTEEEYENPLKFLATDTIPFNEVASATEELWESPLIKEHYNEACTHSARMGDSAYYFFDNIKRITEHNYVPNEQDVLHSRTKTSGVNELNFQVDGARFKVVDVGGQRSERKKWIHCFQDVTAIIFCVGLNEYDLELSEEANVNRMHESLALFEEVVNIEWFKDTAVILFLNKIDLFEEKIKRVDLSVCFPDYKGGHDVKAATRYIIDRFKATNRSEKKPLYIHVTNATNTKNITHVFNDLHDVIIKTSLMRCGLN